jgi:hypothetical protein
MTGIFGIRPLDAGFWAIRNSPKYWRHRRASTSSRTRPSADAIENRKDRERTSHHRSPPPTGGEGEFVASDGSRTRPDAGREQTFELK